MMQTETAIRLGYARNGRAVTFAHDEKWCLYGAGNPVSREYWINWGREFRYDGARARYLVRTLNTTSLKAGNIVATSEQWTDYEGDEAYGDFSVAGGSPPQVTNGAALEPGAWRSADGTAAGGKYLHGDMIGTQRARTTAAGQPDSGGAPVYTAFGERVDGGSFERHGYAGAWGYQTHNITAGTGFPFLHVGARYYDAASGRFLQRDPVGIFGGLNVYTYVINRPTAGVRARLPYRAHFLPWRPSLNTRKPRIAQFNHDYYRHRRDLQFIGHCR